MRVGALAATLALLAACAGGPSRADPASSLYMSVLAHYFGEVATRGEGRTDPASDRVIVRVLIRPSFADMTLIEVIGIRDATGEYRRVSVSVAPDQGDATSWGAGVLPPPEDPQGPYVHAPSYGWYEAEDGPTEGVFALARSLRRRDLQRYARLGEEPLCVDGTGYTIEILVDDRTDIVSAGCSSRDLEQFLTALDPLFSTAEEAFPSLVPQLRNIRRTGSADWSAQAPKLR